MNDKTDRREFLAKPLRLAAAAGLLDCSLFAGKAAAAAKPVYRTLGKTGISMPVVGMGVMNADVPGVVRRAYEVGIRHFDTAAGYQQGRNEEMVGNIVRELGVRDKVTITTKAHLRGSNLTPAESKAQLIRIFEGSLKRLQMDHVDVLLNHALETGDAVRDEGAIEALQQLKKEGKTRFIGFSSHRGQVATLNEAMKLGVFDAALISINYTMAHDQELLATLQRAAKSGIGLFAMKTQAGGTRRPDPKLPSELPPASQTALLKWVLRNEAITAAVPGFTTYEQLEQDFSVASDLSYTAEEKTFLADKSFTAAAQFCQQCGECRGDCPHGVDVPTLMRSHMYAVQYRNYELAAGTLAAIPAGQGLDACAGCDSCQVQCRKTVNVVAKLDALRQIGPRILSA